MATNWVDMLPDFQNQASQSIKNLRLATAVRMALWLMIEKSAAIKKACGTASKRHGVAGKQVEVEVRKILPEEFFEERQRDAAAKHSRSGGQDEIPLSKVLDAKNNRHMRNITLKVRLKTDNKR